MNGGFDGARIDLAKAFIAIHRAKAEGAIFTAGRAPK